MVIASFAVLLLIIAGSLWVLWGEPGEGIGLPVIAAATFCDIYIGQPLYMMWAGQLNYFLTDGMIARALLIAAAALFCFVWGWRRSGRRAKHLIIRSSAGSAWSAQRLYQYGLATACVGTILQFVFIQRSGGFLHAYGAMHGQGFDWSGNTAYLYGSPLWVESGVAMMLVSGSKLKLSGWRGAMIVLFSLAFSLHGILLGSRHDVFSICAILWAGRSLAREKRPTIARAATPLAIACFGALLMLGYRGILYLGNDKPNAPSFSEAVTAGLGSDERSLRQGASGIEFVDHAAILETVDKTDKYELGSDWLYTYTVHLIPRIWWPGKPYRFESSGITTDDVWHVTGLEITNGYAPAIVADLYIEFGLFSLLFLFCLGWCARRLLLHAQFRRTPVAACAYIMLYSLSLNLFGQGVVAILVPLPYSIAPVLIYHWMERSRRPKFTLAISQRERLRATQIRSAS